MVFSVLLGNVFNTDSRAPNGSPIVVCVFVVAIT
jgi:hypothetical protein